MNTLKSALKDQDIRNGLVTMLTIYLRSLYYPLAILSIVIYETIRYGGKASFDMDVFWGGWAIFLGLLILANMLGQVKAAYYEQIKL